MPWLPGLHTPEDDVAFFSATLSSENSWVALVDHKVVGFMCVKGVAEADRVAELLSALAAIAT